MPPSVSRELFCRVQEIATYVAPTKREHESHPPMITRAEILALIPHQGIGLAARLRDETLEPGRPFRRDTHLIRPSLEVRLVLNDDRQLVSLARNLVRATYGAALEHPHGVTSS